MPQLPSRPQEPKKIISAKMPDNISAIDKAVLEAKWNEAARKREESIALETRIPEKPSVTLTYKIMKFGRHWNSYSVDKKGKLTQLLPAPSLFSSAVEAASDKMLEDATKL